MRGGGKDEGRRGPPCGLGRMREAVEALVQMEQESEALGKARGGGVGIVIRYNTGR